jgi:hypothetical protein
MSTCIIHMYRDIYINTAHIYTVYTYIYITVEDVRFSFFRGITQVGVPSMSHNNIQYKKTVHR